MSEEFEERLRKAAGVPTNADKSAKTQKEAQDKAEWERNAPQREAALAYYTSHVVPLINEYLPGAQKVASEAHHSLVESQVFNHAPQVLAQRSFVLQLPPPVQQAAHRGQRPQPQPFRQNVGSLHVTLAHTGQLYLEVPANKQMVQTMPGQGIQVQNVDRHNIEEAFERLLAKLHR